MENQLVGIMEHRATSYGLFARLFASELDLPLLEGLSEFAAQDWGEQDAGQVEMMSYLLEKAGDLAATRQELAVDFAQLFLIHGAHETVAPYPFESAYASPEGALTSDARADFKHRYRAFGLVASEGWNVGEDHIALELQYMQYLSQLVRSALVEGDNRAADVAFGESLSFMVDHMRRWVPVFCNRMAGRAKTAFYHGLAVALDTYLEQDAEFLASQWEFPAA